MTQEPARAGKEDVEAAATGLVAQRLGEVGFPDPGGALNQHILVALDEAPGGQVDDLGPGDGGIEGEVEALERLLEIETGTPEPQGQLLLGPAFDLVFEQALEEVAKRELLVDRLAGPELERLEIRRAAAL
jgi:hypothetical protein